MKFESSSPDAQNCQVVRSLNEMLRAEERGYEAAKLVFLRDSVIRMQGTALANTGLPFQVAVSLIDYKTYRPETNY